MADYTTKEYIKADLGITGTDSDTQIDRYIKAVTAYINKMIFGESNQTLEAADYDEYYDILEVPRNNNIYLKHKPINSISTVTVAGHVLNSDEYELYEDQGKLILWSYTTGRKQLRVQYNAGYLIDFDNENNTALHTLPRELEELTRMLVVERWNERSGGGNLKSESIGSWTKTFFSANERMNGYLDSLFDSFKEVEL